MTNLLPAVVTGCYSRHWLHASVLNVLQKISVYGWNCFHRADRGAVGVDGLDCSPAALTAWNVYDRFDWFVAVDTASSSRRLYRRIYRWTLGPCSLWTAKNLAYSQKCNLRQVAPMENHWNCCYRMSDFKTKMHQIRFFRGSLQRSPEP